VHGLPAAISSISTALLRYMEAAAGVPGASAALSVGVSASQVFGSTQQHSMTAGSPGSGQKELISLTAVGVQDNTPAERGTETAAEGGFTEAHTIEQRSHDEDTRPQFVAVNHPLPTLPVEPVYRIKQVGTQVHQLLYQPMYSYQLAECGLTTVSCTSAMWGELRSCMLCMTQNLCCALSSTRVVADVWSGSLVCPPFPSCHPLRTLLV
jgi:hypothetical protein